MALQRRRRTRWRRRRASCRHAEAGGPGRQAAEQRERQADRVVGAAQARFWRTTRIARRATSRARATSTSAPDSSTRRPASASSAAPSPIANDDVGARQHRRVVDAVADHRDAVGRAPAARERGELVLGRLRRRARRAMPASWRPRARARVRRRTAGAPRRRPREGATAARASSRTSRRSESGRARRPARARTRSRRRGAPPARRPRPGADAEPMRRRRSSEAFDAHAGVLADRAPDRRRSASPRVVASARAIGCVDSARDDAGPRAPCSSSTGSGAAGCSSTRRGAARRWSACRSCRRTACRCPPSARSRRAAHAARRAAPGAPAAASRADGAASDSAHGQVTISTEAATTARATDRSSDHAAPAPAAQREHGPEERAGDAVGDGQHGGRSVRAPRISRDDAFVARVGADALGALHDRRPQVDAAGDRDVARVAWPPAATRP